MRPLVLSLGLGIAMSGSLVLPASADGDRPTDVPTVSDQSSDAPQQKDVVRDGLTDVEVLTLECVSAADVSGTACTWRSATSRRAAGYQLWRIVDGGEREIVWRGGLDHTSVRNRLPADATVVQYGVLAVSKDGTVVGRSRPFTLRLVHEDLPRDVTDVAPVRPYRTHRVSYR